MQKWNELVLDLNKHGIRVEPSDSSIGDDAYFVGKFWAAERDGVVLTYFPNSACGGDFEQYREKARQLLLNIPDAKLVSVAIYREQNGEQRCVVRNSQVIIALNRRRRGLVSTTKQPLRVLGTRENANIRRKIVLDWDGVELIYASQAFAVLEVYAGQGDATCYRVTSYVPFADELADESGFMASTKDCLEDLGIVLKGKIYQSRGSLRYFVASEADQIKFKLKATISVRENAPRRQYLEQQLHGRDSASSADVAERVNSRLVGGTGFRLFDPVLLGREFVRELI